MQVYEHNLKDALSNLRITDEKRNALSSIQRYFGLPDADFESVKRKYGLKAVEMLAKYRLQDKVLDKAERYEIGRLGKKLSLSAGEVDTIIAKSATEVYEAAVLVCVEDGRLDNAEQQGLCKLATDVGLNPDTVRISPQLEERLKYLAMLNELDNSYLPTVHAPGIVLQKAEVAHWQAGAQMLVSKTVTTGYTGSSSSGISIRVMKGVNYRIGSSRSRPIRQQVTQRISGTLVITSKRALFNGTGKSFSITFGSLLSFDPYSDGIGLQKSNGPSYMLELPNFQASEVTFKVLQNAINAFLEPDYGSIRPPKSFAFCR